ncbi:N-acetyltransferase [Actinomadura harenae]|uniref:N-acetyltransferase n=1 Tax=Actinomadura harenae TaxID=2483351 RepID=A0A3M2LZ52_9ACTN|nr:N-acetyltransferase [Actinomadura harenae]RMI42456.1 N-acetyltransferase [Actinomadura harenae]
MSKKPIVPDDFVVPLSLAGDGFRLEPLGPEHNDADLAAWTSSIEHIRATPGFGEGEWPPAAGMSAAANLKDLERHARDFGNRVGFTYTVLDDGGVVVGCLYIYGSRTAEGVTDVRSWVRAASAELDGPLHEAVAAWLASDWSFEKVEYRPGA